MMENEHKTYIDNMKLGDIVAFKLYEKDSKMYSGKIKTIGASKVEIQTKNGKKFIIEKKNIFWVNVNNRWPRFVMNAFKGVDTIEETNQKNIDSVTLNEVEEVSQEKKIVIESYDKIVDKVDKVDKVEETEEDDSWE